MPGGYPLKRNKSKNSYESYHRPRSRSPSRRSRRSRSRSRSRRGRSRSRSRSRRSRSRTRRSRSRTRERGRSSGGLAAIGDQRALGRGGDLQQFISHRRERSRSVKRERSRSVKRERRSGSPARNEGGLDHRRWAALYRPALPPAVLALCMADHCGVCDAPFNGPGQALSHYEGGKHAKKIHFQLYNIYRHIPNEEMPTLVSAIAKKAESKGGSGSKEQVVVALPTPEELSEAMEQPLTDLQEQARDLWDPPLTMDVLVLIKADQCAVCNIAHTSEVDAYAHYAGRPHEKKLQLLLVERAGQGGVVPVTRRSKCLEAAAGAMAQERCHLCNIEFPGQSQAALHYAGKKHEKMLVALESEGFDSGFESKFDMSAHDGAFGMEGAASYLSTEERRSMEEVGRIEVFLAQAKAAAFNEHHQEREKASPHYCHICGMACESEEPFKLHCSGKPHKKKVMKCLQGGVFMGLHCQICNLSFTKHSDMQQHQYQLHTGVGNIGGWQAFPRTFPEARAGGFVVEKEPFRCDVCCVKCNSAETFATHLNGKKHLKALKVELPE